TAPRYRRRRPLPRGPQQRPLRPADGRRRLLPDQGHRHPRRTDTALGGALPAGEADMSGWPQIDYGHTAYDKAVTGGDVYGIRTDPARLAKRPLKVGIIGCGGVAQAKWLPAVKYLQTRSEPVVISGVADVSVEAREKVAALYAVPAHRSIGELLAADRPDLVLILASDDAHAPAARGAIDAGIPVLVEKPLSRSLAEARDLCAFAERKGVLLAGVANKRFSPPYAMAKALVDEGRLKSAPMLFSGKFTL